VPTPASSADGACSFGRIGGLATGVQRTSEPPTHSFWLEDEACRSTTMSVVDRWVTLPAAGLPGNSTTGGTSSQEDRETRRDDEGHGTTPAREQAERSCRAVPFQQMGVASRRLAVSGLGTNTPDISLCIDQNATAEWLDQADLHGTGMTLRRAGHIRTAMDPAAYRNCHGGVGLGR
jgi:hypothetical protein